MDLKELKELINSIDDATPKKVVLRYVDTMNTTCEVDLKRVVEESELGKEGAKRVILIA